MKKGSIFLCCLVIMIMLTGCSEKDSTATNDTISQNEIETKEQLIMVNNILYYNTKQKSTVTRKCGTLDGEIMSIIDNGKIPIENNQSNFGEKYGYQFGANENQIEVNMNNTWIIFEKWNNQ